VVCKTPQHAVRQPRPLSDAVYRVHPRGQALACRRLALGTRILPRPPYISCMPWFLVAYQSHSAEFLGAAIVEAFDPPRAREKAEAAGIH
jgi:hypothetical protein